MSSTQLFFLGCVHFDLPSHFRILYLWNHGASDETSNFHMLLH